MNMHSDILLSQTDHRPMYLQIMEQIRYRVALGDWQPGQELPSIRAMAAALNISVITVKRAYQELEREGLIVSRQGKASFIADKPDISESLRMQEVDQNLESAINGARLIGMNDAELQARLVALLNRQKESNS